MSGHSKWANIKNKKGKADAARGNVFTKIGRELAVAVKQGGADPNSNSRLRDIITKAKQSNMPNDNISRSIKKASGELNSVNYEEMTYEGYGTNGVAIIVEALTDNKNRTAGDVRHLFDKHGGGMGSTGCVSYMFTRKGVIIVEKGTMSEDDIMMLALDVGADDVINDEEVYEIYTSSQEVGNIAEKLKENGCNVLSQQIDMIPDNYIDLDKEASDKITRLIDKFEENDDIQNIYHNANLVEEEEED